MLRVVVDVNVLVSAAFDLPEAPARVVDEWRAGAFEMVVSMRLLDELQEVLERPHIERRLAWPGQAARVVGALAERGILVDDPTPAERLVPADPDDDYLVALARAGRAQVIVTGDADLLEADLDPPAYSPRDFLTRLEELNL